MVGVIVSPLLAAASLDVAGAAATSGFASDRVTNAESE